MELALTKGTTQTTGAPKGRSRTIKPSPSSSPSSSASSRGLSGRVGVRVLMHRDLITCRVFRSMSRSWLKKFWHRRKPELNSRLPSSSCPPRWSSSPFSLSSPPFSSRSSSVSSHVLSSLVFRLSSSALKDRDREREQLAPASSQALDGHPGFSSTPGMTVVAWGTSTQPTAAHTTSSTTAPASSLGHSLRHHNSSG